MTRREAFKGLAAIAVAPWKTIVKSAPVAVRNPAYDLAEYEIHVDPNPYGVIKAGKLPESCCFSNEQARFNAFIDSMKVIVQ